MYGKTSKFTLILAVTCIGFILAGCNPVRFYLNSTLDVRSASYDVSIERDKPIRMTDGVLLRADIFHPVGLEKTPVLLVRMPLPDTLKYRAFASGLGSFFAERGYTTIIQGIRGWYHSEGQYCPLVNERSDGIDTLSWLSKQPYFDGRIGMWGGSYFGFTQLAIASELSTYRSAMFVQLSSPSFEKMLYPGGAFSLSSALYWVERNKGNFPIASSLQRASSTLPLIATDNALGDNVEYFDDWIVNKNNSKFWDSRNAQSSLKETKTPTLLLAGWYDPFLPSELEDYNTLVSAGVPVRLIIGPWGHAVTVSMPNAASERNYRLDSIEPAIPWFDEQLSAQRIGEPSTPSVKIYVMGTNLWREESEWPLKRAVETRLFLRSGGRANTANGDGQLSLRAASADESVDSFVYDPENPVPTRGGSELGDGVGITDQREVEKRSDVLVYSTPDLLNDVEFTGMVSVELFVVSSATTTDFTAKLVDVWPDGRAFNVSDGIVRVEGFDSRSESTRVIVQMWPTSMVFKKGHRIRVEISSSNFPRFDRNRNVSPDKDDGVRMVQAKQQIMHSKLMPSSIKVSVVGSGINFRE